MTFRQKPRARRDPLIALHHRAAHERFAEGHVFTRKAGLARHGSRDVAVVNVNHGRHRNPSHQFVGSPIGPLRILATPSVASRPGTRRMGIGSDASVISVPATSISTPLI